MKIQLKPYFTTSLNFIAGTIIVPNCENWNEIKSGNEKNYIEVKMYN